MGDIAIKIENLSKQYRLGVVGTGTLSHDLKRWWMVSVRGQEDPYLKIGEENDRASKGASDYVWALKDVNLEIKQGDVVGIIGKNGAGKSTLLKILSRVTKPTKGTISYKGHIASLLEVGTGFHQEMTGRENIYMNGSIMGMNRTEITRKFDEIVDFAGVERYIDTPVKRYSSGMTVRLGFSIAAHLEPDILVVDEVLAVGDAEFQKKAIGKMQDVSKGGERTVLFVSHNMGAIKNLCNNGVLINNGRVAKIGKIDEVIHSYLNTYISERKKIEYSFENAPGNREVRLIRAEIKNQKEPIEAGDEVELYFEFLHQSDEIAVYDVTFHLYDEMNNLVFVGSTGSEKCNKTVTKKGLYIAKAIIPLNLLNTGTYNIARLIYVRNRGQIVYEFKDTLSFDVIVKNTGGYGWYGAKEGIVKPKLLWEIQLP